MEKFVINGGNKLYGEVEVQSAKNSVLPLIAASIMRKGKTYLKKCPKLSDVLVMASIIEELGGSAKFIGDTLELDCTDLNRHDLPKNLTAKIRASLFMVGALLTRFKKTSISSPGGCDIGDRPIDIHINSLRDLGVKVDEGEVVEFSERNNRSAKTRLAYKSVGATENLIMASVQRKGVTVIENSAKEPEIVDLANFLNLTGARISGAGSDVITVEGVEKLWDGELLFEPVADRIEVGTFLLAGVICGGELGVKGNGFENLSALTKIIENNACKIYKNNGKIDYIKFYGVYGGFGKVIVDPYPCFPTDLQPQLVSAATFAKGITVVEERVFKKRFNYVCQLRKTGADVSVFDNACVVVGKEKLTGAVMTAQDLRGGASLILQALGAKGTSEVLSCEHIDRGYFKIEDKLRALGADIKRIDY